MTDVLAAGLALFLGLMVVPFALLGYAAGATHVSLWRFSWTTVIGYLPLTIAVAYLGSRAPDARENPQATRARNRPPRRCPRMLKDTPRRPATSEAVLSAVAAARSPG
jgi:membrane protein implicated in regulation of membrane protease activity